MAARLTDVARNKEITRALTWEAGLDGKSDVDFDPFHGVAEAPSQRTRSLTA